MNTQNFKWTRQPKDFKTEDGKVYITTLPHTDLWQRTYYHFRNDNAPVFQMETDEKFFSFIVKTDFTGSHQRFDQCGVVLYLDSDNWIKGSVEYENNEFQHLGSVVTNHGYSDWATTEIPASVKVMWYRLSRREDDYCIECSEDGKQAGEKIVCVIAIGYGENEGKPHRSRPLEKLCAVKKEDMPVWFKNGMLAAVLAPTAVNQQKFFIDIDGEKAVITAGRSPLAKIDLGIVRYNFEAASGHKCVRK